MKKINQINQYLLERFPTIWNTKLVWMLAIALVIHILFFIVGYVSHIDPTSLHGENAINDYFNHGMIFVHLIISILMIVGWLVMMFKNNSFKNFYPTSKLKLFGQYIQYVVIIFVSISFYFSYMFGFRTFINQKYEDKEFHKNIELINKTYPFLSQELELYTVENRLFPKGFYESYCEKDSYKIDVSEPYVSYYDRVYQFWSLYSKTVTKKDKFGSYLFPEPEKFQGVEAVFTDEKEKSITYYFKKDVVDLTPYIKTGKPSYYNFSSVFFKLNDERDVFNRSSWIEYNAYPSVLQNESSKETIVDNVYKRESYKISQQMIELLNRKNPSEIKELFSEFLNVSKKYGVRTNLTPENWSNLVYHPENFEVQKFIKKYLPLPGDTYDIHYSGGIDYSYGYTNQAAVEAVAVNTVTEVADSVDDNYEYGKVLNPNYNNEISPEDFFKANLTENYYYTEHLRNLLTNVETVKNYNFLSVNIHIYLWIAIGFALFIFCFRVTGLKSLIFSGISAGVISLISTLIFFLFAISGASEEFFVMYLAFFIGCVILLIPLLFMDAVGKMVSSILINITIIGFVPWVMLILAIIDYHLTKDCRYSSDPLVYNKCVGLFDNWEMGISYFLLGVGLLFMYFYAGILQKWKAMPEKN